MKVLFFCRIQFSIPLYTLVISSWLTLTYDCLLFHFLDLKITGEIFCRLYLNLYWDFFFFTIRVRLCIIGKNNRGVICPSQYILEGIIPIFIPGHINCDHMAKRGVSQGSPIVLPFIISKYFEGGTLRLCKKPVSA